MQLQHGEQDETIDEAKVHPRRYYTGINIDLQNISILQKLIDSLDDITQDLFCIEYKSRNDHQYSTEDEESWISEVWKSDERTDKRAENGVEIDYYLINLLDRKPSFEK